MVPRVQRPLGRRRRFDARVGIPDLHRRIDVQHVMAATEVEHRRTVDVPGQIDDQIAGTGVPGQLLFVIVGRDPLADEAHPAGEVGGQGFATVDEVEDRDPLRGHFQVSQQERQRALRHAAATQDQNASRKWSRAHGVR